MPATTTHRTPGARARRRALVAAAVGAATLAAAPTASAGIWTPVDTGTTDTITALDHRLDRTILGTTTGKIHVVGAGLRRQYPGLSVTDVEVSPNGVMAIATFTGGFQARSTDGGLTWGDAMSVNSYRPMDENCSGVALPPVAATAIGQDATSITWASDTVAYMTTNLKHSLLKTTDAGASWQELNRRSDGQCNWGNQVGVVTDVAPVVGSSSLYLVNRYFGQTYFSSNGLATAPSQRGEAVNCFTEQPSLAVDSGDPTRVLAGDRCSGRINMSASTSSATTFNRSLTVVGGDPEGIHDVAAVGGTGVWVGKAGGIYTTRDAVTAYRQPADGALATNEWRVVDGFSASQMAVAGSGGALVVATAADSIPAPAPAPGSGSGGSSTPVGSGSPTFPAGVTPGGTSTSLLPGGGASFTLTGPKTCVAAGTSFTATLKMRKLQIKNNRIVKLTRVDFYLNGKRVKIDRKAPFRQRINVPASAPGTVHTLKAKGFVKVKRGKAPKRTQTVKFVAC